MAQRARQRDAILGLAVATAAMLVVVLGKPGPFAQLAWPWYVPLGLAITLGRAGASRRAEDPGDAGSARPSQGSVRHTTAYAR
jgi:hypothetical protein